MQQCEAEYLQEARTGIINLPESASVIEELLATMYEISSPYMERDPGIMDAHENLSFRIAADKVIRALPCLCSVGSALTEPIVPH